MTQPLWSDRLQLPYTAIVEYRRAGGITDEVWDELMAEPDFAAFVVGQDVAPTLDEGNSSDPEEFSPALKEYFKRAEARYGRASS